MPQRYAAADGRKRKRGRCAETRFRILQRRLMRCKDARRRSPIAVIIH